MIVYWCEWLGACAFVYLCVYTITYVYSINEGFSEGSLASSFPIMPFISHKCTLHLSWLCTTEPRELERKVGIPEEGRG